MVPLRTAARVVAIAAAAASGCGGGDGGADAPPCGCDAPNGDAAGSRWSPRADMPAPIQETAAVAIDGKVYVMGGFENGTTITNMTQIYDVATDAWSLGPELPARAHHLNATAVVYGDVELIIALGDLQTTSFEAVGDYWVWAPTLPAWDVGPAMPRPRGTSVIAAIGTMVYVVGGIGPDGTTSAVDALDAMTDEWTELAPLPAPRDHACGGVIDGVLYVAGGRDGTVTAPEDDVYAYDVDANAWTEVAAMPTARGGTACGVVDGRLIVVGGEGNPNDTSGVFAEAEAYDPATDRWEVLEPMTHPRHGMGAAVVDGGLYVPGGADVTIFGAVATHDVFR